MSLSSPARASAPSRAIANAERGGDPATAAQSPHKWLEDERARRRGTIATILVPLLGLLLCIAGTRTGALDPQTIQLAPSASGVAGPLRAIGFNLNVPLVIAALILLVGAYLFAIQRCEHIPKRAIVWSVIAFNLIVLLGPPLFSTDVFSYQAYARMFAVYHTNPYLHGPIVMQGGVVNVDPLFYFVGSDWVNTPSVYGPLFTLLSGAFATSPVPVSEFAFKLLAVLASGGTLYLLWRSAKLRGVNPSRAIAVFGLNPLVTLYGVGGGHNDFLMLLLTTGGVYALLSQRYSTSGVLITGGAAFKLTGALVLPFALAAKAGSQGSDRRRAMLIGAAAATAAISAVSLEVFGFGVFHMFSTLKTVQGTGNTWQSVPGFFFRLAHVHIPRALMTAVNVGLAAVLLRLVYRVWRGQLDWLDGAAWATFAVLVSAWFLLPWYVSWMMPLVALTSDRRLWKATVFITIVGSAIMIAGCL